MRMTSRLRAACLALALAAVVSPVGRASQASRVSVTLSDLRGVDELKTWFNANKGRVRLVLLLSPT